MRRILLTGMSATGAVRIRKARPGEGDTLGDLGFAAWEASAFGRHDAGRTDRAALREAFRRFCGDMPDVILVAKRDGQLLGWGAREQRDQQVSDLWVAPHRQGMGVGQRLLAALLDEIAAAGHDHATVETLASNTRAIAFYRRHGFAEVWRAEKFSATLGYAIDKVGMNKSLSP
jgi:ribosomal-protein-alanine N-acetyltransferase